MARLELRQVRKSYQSLEVIHGIDLVVDDGSFTVFVGPSGCGKSTLLRMMAGLEELSGGEIMIDGQRCDHLVPSARGMAMVFQSYALYPHMSVHENMRFGLVNAKLPKAEIEPRIQRAAEILRIEPLLERRPYQLSGGQSQRVAIGRAIVKEPKAFLFDEPLSNLDAELRVKMRSEIVALHRRLGTTMIYVTHDQVEAMTMADKIVVLREGLIEQAGTPIELYARPVNRFVAGFIGAPQMNFFDAAVTARDGDRCSVSIDEGRLTLALDGRSGALKPGDACSIGIRPEHLQLTQDGGLRVTVEATEVLGSETVVHARSAAGTPVTATMRGILNLAVGTQLGFTAPEAFVHLFGADGVTLPAHRPWQDDYVRAIA
ncbi:ABC transporter ATP-binding protein [Devosia sediminis]|uniref:Sn-glycerol-3-phosphate ABC transporter ATP-binding protein UgpC n=1 Tax=Devosia sediminis TaxID=2798801 RepID=A0A934MIC9_9HYPH|nr:sn-glycerol-3-phosphate ABC transporter ATP-binding protein UgpC [Devosia sediminis]MBJ3786047.1 sn-glycerol-3-phosphate ABC transporter ATP-binding protein UgpC [Devosia sediminis]